MNRIWKNTSVQEVTADVVEKARDVELEVVPEDGPALLQSHDEMLTTRNCFFWMNKESEMESTPNEDAVKIVEMKKD